MYLYIRPVGAAIHRIPLRCTVLETTKTFLSKITSTAKQVPVSVYLYTPQKAEVYTQHTIYIYI